MFRELKSEAILTFNIVTKSPLYIKSGVENSLEPSATDGKYMTTYRNGKLEPFIPGTSLKGAFRSRAERILSEQEACNIIGKKNCVEEKYAKNLSGKERYKKSCPVCRLFGSKVLKSRITFSDANVIGDYRVGERTCVAIDRISGAAKGGALYSLEYIEEAIFQEKIRFQNFEPYQIKLIIYLIEEMNEGFLTLGGMTSKGFGCVSGENFKLKIKYYGKENKALEGYEFREYYNEKEVVGFENIKELVKNIEFRNLKRDGDIDEQTI